MKNEQEIKSEYLPIGLLGQLLRDLHTFTDAVTDKGRSRDFLHTVYDQVYQDFRKSEWIRTGIDIEAHGLVTTKFYRNVTIGYGMVFCILPLLAYLYGIQLSMGIIVWSVIAAVIVAFRMLRYIGACRLVKKFFLEYFETIETLMETALKETEAEKIESTLPLSDLELTDLFNAECERLAKLSQD